MSMDEIAADDFERAWERCREFREQGEVCAAIEVLAHLEQSAVERKVWPDLAAALWLRCSLEYGFAHEDDFFEELLVGSLAERVEAAPPEVRPVLRLLLVHDGLTMNYPRQWWKKVRKRPLFADDPPPWSVELIVSTLASLFEVIDADRDFLLTQKVEDWSRLLSVGDSFTRACCPTLWDFAVYDVVDFVGRMKKTDEILRSKALGWLDGLLLVHPLDTEPDAHLHALYRELHLEGGDKLAFAEKWIGTSAVSADAAHDAAAELAKSEKGEDRERAHAIAERFHARWPATPGGCGCLHLMRSLEEPSFHLSLENQLLAHGETISVTARNLTCLCFRLVPITFDRVATVTEEISNKILRTSRTETDELSKLVKENAAAEWFVLLEDPRDYADHVTACAIPVDLPLGYYALFAATNEQFGADGLPVHCTVVSRTDLHLSCLTGPEGWSGVVSDAETGQPRAGVTVQFWQTTGRGYKIAATTRSAENGTWAIRSSRDVENGFVRACADVPVDAAGLNWVMRQALKRGLVDVRSTAEQGTLECHAFIWNPSASSVPSPVKLHLVTDRAIYHPGKTIRYKGYAYRVNQQPCAFGVVAQRRVSVAFENTHYGRISKVELRTDDFGSFSGEFVVPDDEPIGIYKIEVWLDSWKNEFGESKSFKVKVEECPQRSCAGFREPRESLATKAIPPVDAEPWKIDLSSPAEKWRTASSETAWLLSLRTVDDRPISNAEAEVKAYALKPPDRLLRAWLRMHKWQYDSEEKSPSDPSDPQNWDVGGLVASARTTTSDCGEAKGAFALQAGVYRMEGTAKTESGGLVRSSAFVRVIDPLAKTYATPEAAFSCVEKKTVRVGETARLFFGTGYASATCRVRVIRGNEILAEEMREGTCWVFEFLVTERHYGTLHFETLFMRENRVYHDDHSVTVPIQDLRLKVTPVRMDRQLLPNTIETWRFRVSGADTGVVRPGVEVLALMYDKSLGRRKRLDDYLEEDEGFRPVFPFGDLLPDRNGYGDFMVSNKVNDMYLVGGEWPKLPADGSALWPSWRDEILGKFRYDPDARGPCWLPSEEDDDVYRLDDSTWGGMLAKRTEYGENAFFLPSLMTDENGLVEFSFVVPSVITEWRFVLLAHDCNLANGAIDDDGIVTVSAAGLNFVGRQGDEDCGWGMKRDVLIAGLIARADAGDMWAKQKYCSLFRECYYYGRDIPVDYHKAFACVPCEEMSDRQRCCGKFALVTDVAGIRYAEDWERIVGDLKSGDPVSLLRDPGNAYDANAIAVMNVKGERFGWIPRAVNSTPAALLDRGRKLVCTIADVGVCDGRPFVTLSVRE